MNKLWGFPTPRFGCSVVPELFTTADSKCPLWITQRHRYPPKTRAESPENRPSNPPLSTSRSHPDSTSSRVRPPNPARRSIHRVRLASPQLSASRAVNQPPTNVPVLRSPARGNSKSQSGSCPIFFRLRLPPSSLAFRWTFHPQTPTFPRL